MTFIDYRFAMLACEFRFLGIVHLKIVHMTSERAIFKCCVHFITCVIFIGIAKMHAIRIVRLRFRLGVHRIQVNNNIEIAHLKGRRDYRIGVVLRHLLGVVGDDTRKGIIDLAALNRQL